VIIIKCPECNSERVHKRGYSKEGNTRIQCLDCKERGNKSYYTIDATGREIERRETNRFTITKNRDIFEPLKITRDKVMVASDAHIPLHDKSLFNIMLNVSQEKNIKTLIFDGDLLNIDAFSFFDMKVPEEGEAHDFTWERKEVMEVLRVLELCYDEIIVNMGNHELNRLMQIFKGKLNLKDIFRLFTLNVDKYKITNRDHIILTSGKKTWRICHPRNYSQIKSRVAYRLADKYEMNMISAHGHFCGQAISVSGKYVVVDSGGLFDPKKIAYIQTTNLFPFWNQGFVIIEGGYHELFNPLYRDLSKWK